VKLGFIGLGRMGSRMTSPYSTVVPEEAGRSAGWLPSMPVVFNILPINKPLSGLRPQSTAECRPQSKRRPRMAFTIRWSVEEVAPMPTPMLISHRGDTLRSVTMKTCCC
jgi:hypothetical protein